MKIDKRNGNVVFEESTHNYWNYLTNRKFISVTTLIGKYEHPFNEDFWSSYKSLEKILSDDKFKFEKKKLLETEKIDLDYFQDIHNLDILLFGRIKNEILEEWKTINKISTERGTKIHSKLENSFYKQETCKLQKFGLGGVFTCKKDYTELNLDKGVYPEYLISYEDDGIAVAGQIDLFIKDGNEITLIDYKTNKEIKKTSYFDSKTKKNKMMIYPLTNIQDCNYGHYTLQLSTYAWMLQKLNPEFVIKKLMIIHYDHSGKVVTYDIDYLKDDVELLIKDYKRKLVHDEQERKRSRINY